MVVQQPNQNLHITARLQLDRGIQSSVYVNRSVDAHPIFHSEWKILGSLTKGRSGRSGN